MKFNGYSFPHPVSGLGDDYIGEYPTMNINYDDKTDKENYILSFEYIINNDEINQLIEVGKLSFACEVSCSSTLYRKVFTTQQKEQKILIAKNEVRNQVNLLFLVVANEKLANYSNRYFHNDFGGYQFDIEQGDILAYMGESSFFASISYQKLKAVSSFMEIIKGSEETGGFNIILDGPKIRVELSQKDYEKYSDPRIGKDPILASLFHSSIVLSTLIHAIHRLIKEPADFETYAWAQVINNRVMNEMPQIPFEEINIPKIVQKLLGLPVSRLIGDLFNKQTDNVDEN
ncbi:hypothetical protein [Lacibacter sp. H407]|uniref:hypothetical protein n=1 Tax=Lacibacter sp. H407 TaxID=3133423 RepID=UPI0030BBF1FB